MFGSEKKKRRSNIHGNYSSGSGKKRSIECTQYPGCHKNDNSCSRTRRSSSLLNMFLQEGGGLLGIGAPEIATIEDVMAKKIYRMTMYFRLRHISLQTRIFLL